MSTPAEHLTRCGDLSLFSITTWKNEDALNGLDSTMSALTRSTRISKLNVMSDAEVAHNDASDAQRKAAEREAKKAEVRRRLEEAGNKGKNAKKGFLTPERKKKLRKLLMVKAAEDLKRQQLEKDKERSRILSERIVALPDVDNINDKAQLEAIFNDLQGRLFQLESEKWDINRVVTQVDTNINALTIEVNDLRGKYVKPSLKKVSKYDNKFKKAAASVDKGEKQDFRGQLKVVKKDVMEEIMNTKKEKEDKPDWSKKGAAKEGQEEAKEQKNVETANKEEEIPTEKQEEEEEIEEGEEEEEEDEE